MFNFSNLFSPLPRDGERLRVFDDCIELRYHIYRLYFYYYNIRIGTPILCKVIFQRSQQSSKIGFLQYVKKVLTRQSVFTIHAHVTIERFSWHLNFKKNDFLIVYRISFFFGGGGPSRLAKDFRPVSIFVAKSLQFDPPYTVIFTITRQIIAETSEREF